MILRPMVTFEYANTYPSGYYKLLVSVRFLRDFAVVLRTLFVFKIFWIKEKDTMLAAPFVHTDRNKQLSPHRRN
jgi:hypothetical protein